MKVKKGQVATANSTRPTISMEKTVQIEKKMKKIQKSSEIIAETKKISIDLLLTEASGHPQLLFSHILEAFITDRYDR
jgi:hypothetical protein